MLIVMEYQDCMLIPQTTADVQRKIFLRNVGLGRSGTARSVPQAGFEVQNLSEFLARFRKIALQNLNFVLSLLSSPPTSPAERGL